MTRGKKQSTDTARRAFDYMPTESLLRARKPHEYRHCAYFLYTTTLHVEHKRPRRQRQGLLRHYTRKSCRCCADDLRFRRRAPYFGSLASHALQLRPGHAMRGDQHENDERRVSRHHGRCQ